MDCHREDLQQRSTIVIQKQNSATETKPVSNSVGGCQIPPKTEAPTKEVEPGTLSGNSNLVMHRLVGTKKVD